ncbi:MAG: PepSY-associated TM helix domain-containing protein [Lewinella sp.]|nr:PepSY-associated TM helix domain-containing protein [Lewinella sp.]
MLSRKRLFKIHGWIGVKLSIIFFIVCFSGTLATLSSEMDWLVTPAIRAGLQEELAGKNLMVRNLKAAFPESSLAYWSSAGESYLCDIVHVRDANNQRTYAFVNPYTAEVQGSAKLTMQRYFRDLHYFLFIPFQFGHFTVLSFSFLLLFSMVTALYFYRKWYRKIFDLKRGKGPVVLFRSLHRLVGIWTIPFVMLFSVTGIWYFLERSNIGGISKIANTRAPELKHPLPDSIDLKQFAWSLDYDRAADSARAHIPGLVIKQISPPGKHDRPIYLTGKSDVALVRNRANQVYVHPLTYEVIKVQRADEIPTVAWLNNIADPLHFGNFGGLPTKILWFLAGLGISGLVLTGIWISLKRKVKSEEARKAQRLGGWKYFNWAVVLLMFGFMYQHLMVRYQADWPLLLLILVGWALVGLGAWYLFVYRLKQMVDRARPRVKNTG